MSSGGLEELKYTRPRWVSSFGRSEPEIYHQKSRVATTLASATNHDRTDLKINKIKDD